MITEGEKDMTQPQGTAIPLESVSRLVRECLSAVPVIVIGSGASLVHGLPSTAEVAQHLLNQEPNWSGDSNASSVWDSIVGLIEGGRDIEDALHEVSLPDKVQDYIVELVWRFVQGRDAAAFDTIVESRDALPLTRLFNFFFGTSETELSVVTTNYDRIAEYAADVANRWHYAGFPPGYYRNQHSEHSYKVLQPRVGTKSTELRKISIWKVHGSLDWFTRDTDDTISITAARRIPTNCKPAIITPGLNKYDQALQEPFRSVLAGADRTLDGAKAYLCVGYGFNDRHIHPRLVNRWRDGHAPLLVVARSLSERAVEILSDPRDGRYMALTDMGDGSVGTRISGNIVDDAMELHGIELWNLPGFTQHLL